MINRKCWIRTDREVPSQQCPFGLPIVGSCQYAGSSVTYMCPLNSVNKDKRGLIKKANKRVYVYQKDNTRCIYATSIMEKLKAVNCDFGDTGQGMHAPAFQGSPLYPQTFSGIGLSGLYAFPLGFYADNNESRNLFQGLFSLVGKENMDIIKAAISSYILKNTEKRLKLEQCRCINKKI